MQAAAVLLLTLTEEQGTALQCVASSPLLVRHLSAVAAVFCCSRCSSSTTEMERLGFQTQDHLVSLVHSLEHNSNPNTLQALLQLFVRASVVVLGMRQIAFWSHPFYASLLFSLDPLQNQAYCLQGQHAAQQNIIAKPGLLENAILAAMDRCDAAIESNAALQTLGRACLRLVLVSRRAAHAKTKQRSLTANKKPASSRLDKERRHQAATKMPATTTTSGAPKKKLPGQVRQGQNAEPQAAAGRSKSVHFGGQSTKRNERTPELVPSPIVKVSGSLPHKPSPAQEKPPRRILYLSSSSDQSDEDDGVSRRPDSHEGKPHHAQKRASPSSSSSSSSDLVIFTQNRPRPPEAVVPSSHMHDHTLVAQNEAPAPSKSDESQFAQALPAWFPTSRTYHVWVRSQPPASIPSPEIVDLYSEVPRLSPRHNRPQPQAAMRDPKYAGLVM